MAISGGVDSMALATLMNDIKPNEQYFGPLKAFIVDHGLRRESTSEAYQVSDELLRLGIQSQVLRLDWSEYGDPKALSNFESAARNLRYRALGRACYQSGIGHLLVAHHADDQAETVLSRILAGYNGTGLSGTASEAKIPTCEGIYGVDGSGRPRPTCTEIGIEAGGVILHRPLLSFSKERLIAVCKEAGTKWFEDPTNTKPSVTLRNAVRHLHNANALPEALRKERLLKTAAKIARTKRWIYDYDVPELLKKIPMTLDLRFGTLEFALNVPFSTEGCYADSGALLNVGQIKAEILRRMLRLVSPLSDIPLPDLDAATDYVYGESSHQTSSSVTVAGVQIMLLTSHHVNDAYLRPDQDESESENKRRSFLLRRAAPSRHKRIGLRVWTCANRAEGSEMLKADPQQPLWDSRHWLPQWHLWDARYWIRLRRRVSKPDSPTHAVVRFLTPEILGRIRASLTTEQKKALAKALAAPSIQSRASLPVLIATNNSDQEQYLALPTIGWSNPNMAQDEWDWDIRYKSIDFEETKLHKLIS